MRGANRRHQSGAAPALLRSGDLSVVAPPVPIPNTEVKRCSPDGSTAIGRARVGRRQNKNPGEFITGVFAFCQRLLEQRTVRLGESASAWGKHELIGRRQNQDRCFASK